MLPCLKHITVQYKTLTQKEESKSKRDAAAAFTEVKTCCYCTKSIPIEHLQNAPLSSTNCISPLTLETGLVCYNNDLFKISLHKINTNTLQIIMNVLSFFNSPRHSGSNVGNKYIFFFYTKSHQAGGGWERIVIETTWGEHTPFKSPPNHSSQWKSLAVETRDTTKNLFKSIILLNGITSVH